MIKLITPQPYINRLQYFIQTKLECELPKDLLHDIQCAMFEYGTKCSEISEKEKLYWRQLALKNT